MIGSANQPRHYGSIDLSALYLRQHSGERHVKGAIDENEILVARRRVGKRVFAPTRQLPHHAGVVAAGHRHRGARHVFPRSFSQTVLRLALRRQQHQRARARIAETLCSWATRHVQQRAADHLRGECAVRMAANADAFVIDLAF